MPWLVLRAHRYRLEFASRVAQLTEACSALSRPNSFSDSFRPGLDQVRQLQQWFVLPFLHVASEIFTVRQQHACAGNGMPLRSGASSASANANQDADRGPHEFAEWCVSGSDNARVLCVRRRSVRGTMVPRAEVLRISPRLCVSPFSDDGRSVSVVDVHTNKIVTRGSCRAVAKAAWTRVPSCSGLSILEPVSAARHATGTHWWRSKRGRSVLSGDSNF